MKKIIYLLIFLINSPLVPSEKVRNDKIVTPSKILPSRMIATVLNGSAVLGYLINIYFWREGLLLEEDSGVPVAARLFIMTHLAGFISSLYNLYYINNREPIIIKTQQPITYHFPMLLAGTELNQSKKQETPEQTPKNIASNKKKEPGIATTP